MVVENIVARIHDNYFDYGIIPDTYLYAKEILSAIRNEEIKAELLEHEANLETRD
jgi:hypothetical protein